MITINDKNNAYEVAFRRVVELVHDENRQVSIKACQLLIQLLDANYYVADDLPKWFVDADDVAKS